MKVYEALPPLSPRAGFLRTVSGWRDAALVEFGPEGTMHYAQSAIHGETDNLFTTGMEEKQIIFGDTANLEAAIREVDARRAPEVLFVTSSPVSEIIGTDLLGVCRSLQPELHGRILCWDRVPMEGTEAEGQRKACALAAGYLREQAARFPGKKSGEKKQVLILGLNASDWNGTADLNELRRMLARYLGLTCLNENDGRFRLSELVKADWILVVDPAAAVLAETARELWGTPWYGAVPYGIAGSEELLRNAEESLGLVRNRQWETDRREVDRLISQFRMSVRTGAQGLLLDVRAHRQGALERFLSREAGLFVKLPENDGQSFSGSGVVAKPDTVRPGDIFLGCGTACALYPGAKALCMDYPTSGQLRLTPYVPYMGLHGAANLLNALYPLCEQSL